MPELVRSRDMIVLKKGDAYPVTVSEEMVLGGWKGAQGVQWAPPNGDEFRVTYYDSVPVGFMFWGSDEEADQFTSMTRFQPYYRMGIICFGGWHIQTSTFERYTYASRVAGGPLVPIEYHASDRLLYSLRGYFTKEDEWTLSGDPRAPNTYYIAFVTQSPSALTGFYMGVQVAV